MSVISEIFTSYKRALTTSRDLYANLYSERAENGREFYEKFFHHLIIPFRPVFENSASREYVGRQVERFFGTRHLDFVAIDGTCYKDPFNDFIVFFGGAYGAKGRISLEGHPPAIRYQRWEMNRDVSMVAWIPVPFAQLSEVTGPDARETFLVSDSDRVNLASIHTMLMQLAEVYLAYNVAVASVTDPPRLIMIDQSMSGIMAAASHGANTELAGYPYDRRSLDQADIVVAIAHPFNPDLGIPSTKRFRRYTSVLAFCHQTNKTNVTYTELEEGLGLSRVELISDLAHMENEGVCTLDAKKETVTLKVNCRESWAYTIDLFKSICRRLFIEKDQSALRYEKSDPDNPAKKRQAWMSPDDISFLIAVGLRALVEECWSRRILLVGIVKDSESRYLTRNYLGVMRHLGIYPNVETGLLPWTDRIYLETIPIVCDDELETPWSSVEFDSTFMTVHLGTDANERQYVMGTKTMGGEIVAPERLFMRSLAQFYLNRSKRTPLMGHVVFVDRLAFPGWDSAAGRRVTDAQSSLGQLEPLIYSDRDADNVGQAITMYLLSTLTRNHFPEVIGYPDPLHKADLGAKAVGQRVRGIVQSSEISFRSNPIAKTLRAIRDAQRR